MANEINATTIDDVLAKAAEAYVKTAYKEQYEIECLGLVLSQDKWNGYDLLDAFKEGAKLQKKQVWHKPDEPIENDAEVLIEYENGFHDVACYIKDEDVFDTGACLPTRKHITRWAYTKDLIHL